MPETIPATYKGGCLYPLYPLSLPDNEAVHIIILPDKPADEKDEISRIMVNAGLMRAPRGLSTPVPPDPVSEKERFEIAKKMGQAKGMPLSEIIISERGR